MSTKQDVANYIIGLPGAAEYFGENKLQQWGNGEIQSAEFDRCKQWYDAGDLKTLNGWVGSHTQGNTVPPTPGFTNAEKIEDYTAEIALFQSEVDRINKNIAMYVSEGNPDPGAMVVLNKNLNTSEAALSMYQEYQKNAGKNLKKGKK